MYKYCYSNKGAVCEKVYELTIACFSRIEMYGNFCHNLVFATCKGYKVSLKKTHAHMAHFDSSFITDGMSSVLSFSFSAVQNRKSLNLIG